MAYDAPNIILSREETFAYLAERGIFRTHLPEMYPDHYQASDQNGEFLIKVERIKGEKKMYAISMILNDRYLWLQLLRRTDLTPEEKMQKLEAILDEHDLRFEKAGWLCNYRDYD